MIGAVAIAARLALVSGVCVGLTLALTSDLSTDDGAFDPVSALLTVVACAPFAVRQASPVATAVVSLAATLVGSALGYTMAAPIVVALALVGLATSRADVRMTGTLGVFSGACMAVVVATHNDENLLLLLVGGFAVGMVPALVGERLRSERARTRDAHELAGRVEELRDRDVKRAVVEERLRIARDMHDITGHHLSAIALQAAGAGATTADPVARAEFIRLQHLARGALGQTRRALGLLRQDTDPLAPTPQLAHLEHLLEPARRAGIEVMLHVEDSGSEMSEHVELCAYRIVQESLTNVMRHADARTVSVVLHGDGDVLTIAVDDDGRGSDGGLRAGSGIEGMRERARILGGSFAAEPRTAGGWSVRATLPLEARP